MKLIGQGGIWKIYKIENQNNVFRIPIHCSDMFINRFIENYDHIKKLGLSTLKKVEKHEIEGHIGILCDDINYSDKEIYVTYNSLYSNSQKLIHVLNKKILGEGEERKSSLAEDFRYENKIDELTNFEEFVTNIKSDLKLAAKNDILIEFDSYFFGTQKQSSISKIDYKIVDLDHIFINNNKNELELFDLNLLEFLKAIKGFLKYFITENKQSKYLDYLEK